MPMTTSISRPRTSDRPHVVFAACAAHRGLYRLGGLAALLTLGVVLADIVVTMLPGETDPPPGTLRASGWFALLHDRPLLGLRNLGLLNVANLLLSLPLFAALYAAHRRVSGPWAAAATLLQLLGVGVYAANNPALPMLDLSGRYAASTTDAERATLLAAGDALLAHGEDFTPGAFPGFFLTSVASMVMAGVVLRSGLFGRFTGWTGLLGPGLLLLFTTWTTFVQAAFGPAMAIATIGGLISLAWYALLARGLLTFGQVRR